MTKPSIEPTKIGPFRVAPHVRDGELSGRWMIDLPPAFSPSGKRKRIFLESKSAAITEAKRLIREFQLSGAIQGHGPKLAGLTLAELAKAWTEEQLQRVETRKKRAASLVNAAFWTKNLLAHFKNHDVAKIGSSEIVGYQRQRLEAGRSPSTVNSETALLVQMLSWAHERDLVGRLPKIEAIPVPRKRVAIPTLDEMRAILEALPPTTALLVRFLAETGCRKGEAFNLEWADLSTAENVVMIRRKDGWTPKTAGSDRDIPVDASLMRDLSQAQKDGRRRALAVGIEMPRWVFPGRGGVRMTDFDKALLAAVKKANVVRDGKPIKLTPHTLRKANATWLKMRGVDDALLQPRLGHTPGSRITASTYVHVTTDAMRSAVIDLASLRPIDGNPVAMLGTEPRVAKPELATNGNRARK